MFVCVLHMYTAEHTYYKVEREGGGREEGKERGKVRKKERERETETFICSTISETETRIIK